YLLVGASYDTWFTGAAENGTGVATLIETAERIAEGDKRKRGVVFVAFDASELGHLGGYDFLRKHLVVAHEPMLAFIDFRVPGAGFNGLRRVGYSEGGPIESAITSSETAALYVDLRMSALQAQLGGRSPSDAEGMYRAGFQGMVAACEGVYANSTADA